ncbi:MAG: DUF4192 domain-containing protein [Propionibacteriaceae bacterium]|nr:DUF4192 domain-containing protein [Propionibacteriaceae bacterium]
MSTSSLESQFSPVQGMQDLLAAVPAILGYRPRDSVVVVVCLDRRVELTLRIDMDWFLVDYDAVADQLANLRSHYPQARIFLLGYSGDQPVIQAALTETAETLGEVDDIVYTNDQRWWSLTCADDCCPPEGRPFDYAECLVTAEAVLAGIQVSRDRAELVALVAGPSAADLEAARRQVVMARKVLAGEKDAVGQALTLRMRAVTGGEVNIENVAWWIVALADPEVLGALLATLNPDLAPGDREWLLRVVAQCPPEWAEGPVALLAFVAWLSGGGPVMSAALDRLRGLNPRHPVISVLEDLVHRLISPATWSSSG